MSSYQCEMKAWKIWPSWESTVDVFWKVEAVVGTVLSILQIYKYFTKKDYLIGPNGQKIYIIKKNEVDEFKVYKNNDGNIALEFTNQKSNY
jgi:hypothetical protein